MSGFLAFYNLSSIADPKEFLGTAKDRLEDHVIATLGKNMIVVINIRSQAAVHSWTTVDKLSSKVVYDRNSQQYVGVFVKQGMRLWTADCGDVNKCKKLRFRKPIEDVICSGEDTFVIYSNGTCQLLEKAISERQEQEEIDDLAALGSCPLRSTITRFSNGQRLLTYFEHDNDTKRLSLVKVPLYGSGEPVRYNLQRGNLDVQLVGSTVFEGINTPMLFTVWSDRRVFIMSLKDDVLPSVSPGHFMAMLGTLNVKKQLAVVNISRNSVAIYGANNPQEGASLLIYNTQYKIIKTQQFFKIHLESTRLFADERHIYLAMAQNLSVVVFEQTEVLLADLVGLQCSNKFETYPLLDVLDEDETLTEYLNPVEEHELQEVEVNPKNNVLEIFNKITKLQYADGLEVPYEQSKIFDETLFELMENDLQVELYESSDNMLFAQPINLEFMTNSKDQGFSTQQVKMLAYVMERCGASEQEITEKLLSVLITADELKEVLNCLRRYANISDKGLAKTLNYLLGKLLTGKPTEKTKRKRKSSDRNGVSEEVGKLEEEVLEILLSCNFDSNTLGYYLRLELSEEKVIWLLEYLYEMMVSSSKLSFSERPAHSAECINLELQVLRWFGVLLSTYFQKLVLNKSEELLKLLLNWRQLFKLYKGDIGELESTAALLYNLAQRRKSLKQQTSQKWYTIEEICF